MEMHSGGRRVEIRGDRVFVDGKEVPPGEGISSDAEESLESKTSRSSLEARYPGVSFKGDCSKIQIDDGVTLEPGVTLEQNDTARIEILGSSRVCEGAYLSTPESTSISMSSVSFGGGSSFQSIQVSGGGSSDHGLLRIENSTVGAHAEVSGLAVAVEDSTVAAKARIRGQVRFSYVRAKSEQMYSVPVLVKLRSA
ncbi:MAG: hypothetical protein KDD64_16210, partial [Bdellovibrionales bacterium]|nr:hypothetical protein [Bdellovibrionales bacterium]